MHSKSFIFPIFAICASVALTAPAKEDKSHACWTWTTDKPVPYKTQYIQPYPTKCDGGTTTRTVTSKLPKSTVTSTATTTVTASTSTLTDTETSTSTTTTTTTTTETSTSTVATTTGFLPIQSTLPDSSYSGSGGPVVKRDIDVLGLDIGVGSGSADLGSHGTSKKQYPKEVKCYQHGHGKCVYSKSTVTTTKTVTPRGPVTTTTTESSTIYPSATTTITTTTTETSTSTSTTTTTTTTTETTVATPNCNPDNFADTYAGSQKLAGFYINSGGAGDTYAFTTTADAQTCCLNTLLVPGAEIFAFFAGNGNSVNCGMRSTTNTCSSQGYSHWTSQVQDVTLQNTLGNLGCGIFDTYEVVGS